MVLLLVPMQTRNRLPVLLLKLPELAVKHSVFRIHGHDHLLYCHSLFITDPETGCHYQFFIFVWTEFLLCQKF